MGLPLTNGPAEVLSCARLQMQGSRLIYMQINMYTHQSMLYGCFQFHFLRRPTRHVGSASFEHPDFAVHAPAIKIPTLLCSPKHLPSPLDGS